VTSKRDGHHLATCDKEQLFISSYGLSDSDPDDVSDDQENRAGSYASSEEDSFENSSFDASGANSIDQCDDASGYGDETAVESLAPPPNDDRCSEAVLASDFYGQSPFGSGYRNGLDSLHNGSFWE
jgi:hypothetical protein